VIGVILLVGGIIGVVVISTSIACSRIIAADRRTLRQEIPFIILSMICGAIAGIGFVLVIHQ
jgi:hypothetical protein